jgi:hypothetical protein
LAIAYTDARAIQDRLDEVLGVDGWQDDYETLADGSVVCRLKLRFGSEWIIKVDVGSPSEQPDGGDRTKAAFSDALKRAAVKFGVGRYLYKLPTQWCDWDAKAKRFVKTPQLPGWALPKCKAPAPTNEPVIRPSAQPAHETNSKPNSLPADGPELERRLSEYDAKLAAEGVIMRGDLESHIVKHLAKCGYGQNYLLWTEAAIRLAVQETKEFEARARAKEDDRLAREKRLTAPRSGGQRS